MFSIGELGRRTGVKVPTIRYYEQAGLLDPPPRTAGNQRRYGRAALDRLTFIRHARELGMPLSAIRELARVAEHPDQPCAEADRIAKAHLEEVRARIARLRRLEAELERIAAGCGAARAAECRVIAALAEPVRREGAEGEVGEDGTDARQSGPRPGGAA